MRRFLPVLIVLLASFMPTAPMAAAPPAQLTIPVRIGADEAIALTSLTTSSVTRPGITANSCSATGYLTDCSMMGSTLSTTFIDHAGDGCFSWYLPSAPGTLTTVTSVSWTATATTGDSYWEIDLLTAEGSYVGGTSIATETDHTGPWTHTGSVTGSWSAAIINICQGMASSAGSTGTLTIDSLVGSQTSGGGGGGSGSSGGSGNSSITTPNCINTNPMLNYDGEGWDSDGMSYSNPVSGAAIQLNIGQHLGENVHLNEATAYTVTVVAQPVDTLVGTASVSINAVTANLTFTIGDPTEWSTQTTAALSIGAPYASPDLYYVNVINTSPGNNRTEPNRLRVEFVCVSETTPKISPGHCYFDDAALNMTSPDSWSGTDNTYISSWTDRGGATQSGGYWLANETGEIHHAIDISSWVDASTTFHITISAMSNRILPTADYKLKVYIDDGETETDLGYITGNNMIIWWPSTLDFTLDPGTHLTGDLYIENVSNTITTDTTSVAVGAPCLAVEGGIWPGYENPDTSSTLLEQDCSKPMTPTGIDPVAWLQWIGGWIRYSITCLLFGLINGVWGTVQSGITAIGQFGLWLLAVARSIIAWAGISIGIWFGNLIAALIPIANLIISWIGSLPLVQSVLDTFGIASIWINGIWSLLLAILALFGTAMQFIGVLVNLISTSWSAFIAGFTSSSSITLPFPDCSNSSSLFYDGCLVLDVLNFLGNQVPALLVLANAASVAIAFKRVRKAWLDFQDAIST